jgi:iron complex outermembrane receptor protein
VRDEARRTHAGFRSDAVRQLHQLTLQGELFDSDIDQAPSLRRVSGGNLLARWSHDDGGRRTQVQGFFDRSERRQPGLVNDRLDTWDIEFQQSLRPRRHEVLWGAGLRRQHDSIVNLAPAVLQVLPADRNMHLWNVFAQDEVDLGNGLRLTAGLKAEHNGYTGLEWLPTVRLAWQTAPASLVWAALSRTVRTPSRVDRDVVLPQLPRGGAGVEAEVAQVAEVGWRAQPAAGVSTNTVLFFHKLDRLRSIDIAAGGAGFGNSHEAHLAGLEAWGRWRLGERLRAQASFVHQRLRISNEPGRVVAPGSDTQLANDPRNRASLGFAWDFGANMELDATWRYMGALPAPAVPAYHAVDLRWGWRPRPDFEVSLALRNLNDPRHAEWGAAANRAEFRRSVLLKAVWRR